MRAPTDLEQEALNTFSANGLTEIMLLTLNLPDLTHIWEGLSLFDRGHMEALTYLFQNGFSAAAACEEIKELNSVQGYLIGESIRFFSTDKRIQGAHLRNLQMGDSFDFSYSELAKRLLLSGKYTSEEICNKLQNLSAEEVRAMNSSLFGRMYPGQKTVSLFWASAAFFARKEMDGESRTELMQHAPKHIADRVLMAADMYVKT